MYNGIMSFCHIFWISLSILNIFLTISHVSVQDICCFDLFRVSHSLEENKAKDFEVVVPDFFTPSSGF
jgi:hypothetical protein